MTGIPVVTSGFSILVILGVVFLLLLSSVATGAVLTALTALSTVWGRSQARAPIPAPKQSGLVARQRRDGPFWRWPTTLAFLIELWAAERVLTHAGMNPHAHPVPFVLFGLTLGLGLTWLERRGRLGKEDGHRCVAPEAA